MKEVNEIIAQIKKGECKPVYVFDGEEPYYIDRLCDAFENGVLQPHEKDFNFTVFYGKDTEWKEVVNECRSYPAFAARRLVLLKEASQMKDFSKLDTYLTDPSPTTILVIAHKYKKIDGRSSIPKLIRKHGVYITFDKIKDHSLSEWIKNYCSSHNIQISAPNADLLSAYLGNDLQKIANELEKVLINVGEKREITEELIEKNIGISKEYNVFEFTKSVMGRNTLQCFRIVNYYMANPKEGSPVMITALLYSEFMKLYRFHYARNIADAAKPVATKIPPFAIKDFQRYAQFYSLKQTGQAIQLLHQYNLAAVGYNASVNDVRLLKELSVKLLSL